MKGRLLDTNICIYAMNGDENVLAEFSTQSPTMTHVSVITEAELRTGAAKSNSPAKTLRRLENFLRPLQILEFNSTDASAYAKVRATLERAGTPIGPLDMLIGAHALSRGLILVTNNEREFSRIPGLSLENWKQ